MWIASILAQDGFPPCLDYFCPGTQSPQKKSQKTGAEHQIPQTQARGVLQDPSVLMDRTFVPLWLDGGTEGLQERHSAA